MRCYPHYRGHISCEVVTIVIARLRLAAGGTERDPAVSQDSHRVKAAPPGRTIQTAVLIKMETLSDTEYRCYPDQSQLSIEIS